jgi:2-keto-4-pentenoate hydratase
MDASVWLAEALETGNPLAPLPPEAAPRSLADGMRIAAGVLERTGLVPCGLRLAPGGPRGKTVPGPVLEGRLIPAGGTLALAALRHPRASAAVVSVLAEDLPRRGDGLPAFAAFHPAIDVAASRFRDPPQSAALLAADLGGLGQVVVGRRVAGAGLEEAALGAVPVAFGPANRRPRRGEPVDLASALDQAAAVARRLGGLPAGAVLVVAGLSAEIVPEPGMSLAAGLGPLGRAVTGFA